MSFLLGTKASDYENKPLQNGLKIVDKIAKKSFGHNLSDIISEIQRQKPSGKTGTLLSKNFDGYSGDDFIKTLESVYLECRYPIPDPIYKEFPIEGKKGFFRDPVYSSGLSKFCYAIAREILEYIRDDFAMKKCLKHF